MTPYRSEPSKFLGPLQVRGLPESQAYLLAEKIAATIDRYPNRHANPLAAAELYHDIASSSASSDLWITNTWPSPA
jgi:hypothetical protein